MDDPKMKLIERWFKKSEEDSLMFDKFIALWISFNAFYAGKNKDRDSVIIFSKTYEVLFQEALKDDSFKKQLKEITNNPIYDLRFPFDEKRSVLITEKPSLKEYILFIYQVRCNLFHGGKHWENKKDGKLVEDAYKTLSFLLKQVYKK